MIGGWMGRVNAKRAWQCLIGNAVVVVKQGFLGDFSVFLGDGRNNPAGLSCVR
jgi:hypothetical protein